MPSMLSIPRRTTRCLLDVCLLAALVAGAPQFQAAIPPFLINYQGVLRDAAGAPLEGPFGMAFRFWDAPLGGNEILVNVPDPVFVHHGLFNVMLGSGTVADGSGPGAYANLRDVFREFEFVFLSVEIGGETLEPRVQIVSAAYALNAAALDGNRGDFFLDRSEVPQVKPATLTCSVPNARAELAVIKTVGDDPRAFGIDAEGAYAGGRFRSGTEADTKVAFGDVGIDASGAGAGGWFRDIDGTSWASLAYTFRGIEAYGDGAGGYFANTNGGGFAYIGQSDTGIRATGTAQGGVFNDGLGSSSATLAEQGGWGISASGTAAGGRFFASGASGRAWLANGDYGIHATGDTAGGWFSSAIVEGRTTTGSLEITGGSDVAERFTVRGQGTPGSVVVIEDGAPGELAVSTRAYDRRVAGIVAGAGDLRPGLVLGADSAPGSGLPVALSGRVWCRASAQNGPIRPGDSLTTSDLPGHAMRAEPSRAPGTVLGKAMSTLEEGEGLVLVLVHLQ